MTWRIFAASWKHLVRNGWISLATVFVFMLALLSVNVLIGVQAVADRVAKTLEDRVDVAVTFKPDTPDAILTQAHFYLTSLSQVQSVRDISRADALAQFNTLHAGDEKVLAAVSELTTNPLGAQIIIKAKRTEDYPFLMQAVQNPQFKPFIERQTYDAPVHAIDLVQSIGRQVRLSVAALVAIFAFFGLMIAFNAIRVAIYTQREEIRIMRLVGASSAYIRGPFILEGLWLAIISFLFSAAITGAGIYWAEPLLRKFFDGQDAGLTSYFLGNIPILVLFEFGGLAILAMGSSWLAAGKYIKR
jgi:cell division transport system permease protein